MEFYKANQNWADRIREGGGKEGERKREVGRKREREGKWGEDEGKYYRSKKSCTSVKASIHKVVHLTGKDLRNGYTGRFKSPHASASYPSVLLLLFMGFEGLSELIER